MSVRRALGWSYIGQASSFVIQFATSLVLARILSPYEFGVFAMASGISAVIAIFASFNVGSYVIREKTLNAVILRSAMTANAMFAVILAAALGIAALVALEVSDNVQIAEILAILAIATVLASGEFIPSTLASRELRFDFIAKVAIARAIATSVTTVLMAIYDWGPLSFAFGSLAGCVTSVTIFITVGWAQIEFKPSIAYIRPITIFGLQMMSIGGVAQVAARLSDLFLGWSLGLASLGLYSRASGVANLLFFGLYGAATNVIYAKMASDMRETGQFHDTFMRAISIITAVMWPLIAGIGILSGPLIYILYGPKWLDAALPLAILMIAQFIAIGFGMNWEVFVLRGQTATQTKFEIVRAIIGTAAFAVGSTMSVAAACVGRVIEVAVGYALYRPKMDTLIGSLPGELERIYVRSFGLTLAAVWPSVLLMFWRHWQSNVSAIELAFAVSVGGASWVALAWCLDHPVIEESMRLDFVRRRFPMVSKGR